MKVMINMDEKSFKCSEKMEILTSEATPSVGADHVIWTEQLLKEPLGETVLSTAFSKVNNELNFFKIRKCILTH